MSDKPFPVVTFRNNIYLGERTQYGCVVTVNGKLLDPRFDIRNHSPDGFEWGYWGSGPAQLSLAILCYEYDETIAQAWYQDFKFHCIGNFKVDKWSLSSEQIYYRMTYIRNERARVEKQAP